MSFVVAAPEALLELAGDLAGIGSTLSAANAAAVAQTTGVVAAGADQVSTQIAALFDAHARAIRPSAPGPRSFMIDSSGPWSPAGVPMRPLKPPTRGLCRPWNGLCLMR